jgi:hypothetical protein
MISMKLDVAARRMKQFFMPDREGVKEIMLIL